tara:strand:+ start:2569 stop:4212 length:1644 start_codon:yes stop_codon:yes gene_type:complete
MPLLEYALEYAKNGFYVFPLAIGRKIPAFAGGKGHNDATIDLAQIREWWADQEYNIGIACGIKSNLSVIDLDGKQGMDSAKKIKTFIPKTLLVKTPRGTHIYLRHNEELKTTTNIMEKVDIRSEGGYVVAPPSVVDGVTYEFKDPDIAIATMHHVPDLLKIRERTNGVNPSVTTESTPNWVSQALRGVGEGLRDSTAIKLAGYFHGLGMPEDIMEGSMMNFANNCTPPYPVEDLRKTIKSAVRYPNVATQRADIASQVEEDTEQTRNLSAAIREWIDRSDSWWTTDELDNELGIRTPREKHLRSQVLLLLKTGTNKKIRQHQTVNKRYRKVDSEVIGLDYKKQQDVKVLDLRWPLGIEDLVNIYPSNLAVVAGSPNSGKTALLLNVIRLNQDRMPIYYFCSEMGVQELQGRLELFDAPLADWKFEAIERSSNFADVIVPDCINIIDFMELTEDVYKVNTYLTELTHVIGNGVVIVAVQKKIGALMGRGQEFSLEKPRLYLSLDDGKIKIAKGKHWAQKNYNPSGLERFFSIVGGAYFIPSTGWQDPR